MSNANTCQAKNCRCGVDGADAMTMEGRRYCSQRCAEGRGCDHADCNCGDFPAAEPEAASNR